MNFQEIENALKTRQWIYNLTLGVANFSASITKIHEYEATEIEPTNDFIAIHSAIPSAAVAHFLINDEDFSIMSFLVAKSSFSWVTLSSVLLILDWTLS